MFGVDGTFPAAPIAAGLAPAPELVVRRAERASAAFDFHAIYADHFAFVWRSTRRLGVSEACVEDIVQDIFLTVYRRLPSFEGRSSLKTWLFGIVLGIVRNHRRGLKRKAVVGVGEEPSDDERIDRTALPGPLAFAEQVETVRVLYSLLD